MKKIVDTQKVSRFGAAAAEKVGAPTKSYHEAKTRETGTVFGSGADSIKLTINRREIIEDCNFRS